MCNTEGLARLTCLFVLDDCWFGLSPSSHCHVNIPSITPIVREMALTWWGRPRLPLKPYAEDCQDRCMPGHSPFYAKQTCLLCRLPVGIWHAVKYISLCLILNGTAYEHKCFQFQHVHLIRRVMSSDAYYKTTGMPLFLLWHILGWVWVLSPEQIFIMCQSDISDKCKIVGDLAALDHPCFHLRDSWAIWGVFFITSTHFNVLQLVQLGKCRQHAKRGRGSAILLLFLFGFRWPQWEE